MLTYFHSNILRIEKSLYKKGINVALHHAERTKTYRKFLESAGEAITRQIMVVAKDHKKIDSLLLLAKAENPGLLTQIGVFLEDHSFGKEINLTAFLTWGGTQGGQAALDKLNIQGKFALKDPEVIKFFDDHANLIIDSVDDTTKEWIADQIQAGKDKLLTPAEIGDSLESESEGISSVRADMIARTETANALVHVELEAADRYGIQEKIWRTSLDDRVDEICAGLEGERVGINEDFSDGSEGPPAHTNCRCFIEEVVPENWQAPEDPWLGE